MTRHRRPLAVHFVAIAFLVASLSLVSGAGVSSASVNPTLSSVDLGTVPRGVAVNPNSGAIYTVLFLNGTTVALEPQTLQVFGRVATPSPYAVAVNPQTNEVYVSQGEDASVAVVDSSANEVLARIQGAGTPYALAFDEPQDLLFAADTAENSLWVINGSTNAVAARLPMGDTSALAFDPGTREVFVGNLSSDFKTGTVVAFSSDTLKVEGTIQIPIPPGHFAVDPTTHLLFVASGGAGTGASSSTNFLAINETTMQVVYGQRVGESPDIIAFASSPDLFVSDPGQNRLYELDGRTGQVLLNSSGNPQGGTSYAGITGMAYDPGSGALYITERESTSLIILHDEVIAAPQPDYTAVYVGVLLLAGVVVAAVVLRRGHAPAETPRTSSLGHSRKSRVT